MKLADVLILSLAVVFIIISIHQVMTVGLSNAYWAVMLAFILFFVFLLRKNKT